MAHCNFTDNISTFIEEAMEVGTRWLPLFDTASSFTPHQVEDCMAPFMCEGGVICSKVKLQRYGNVISSYRSK